MALGGWRPVKKWKTHKPAFGAVPDAPVVEPARQPEPVFDAEGNRVATDRYAHLAGES